MIVAITGAARGIGLATAQALKAQGAKVAIGDIDETAIPDGFDRSQPSSTPATTSRCER